MRCGRLALEMTYNRTTKKHMIPFVMLSLLACVAMTGCTDCLDSRRSKKDYQKRFIASQRQICNAMSDPEMKRQCHERVDEYNSCLTNCISDLYRACRDGDVGEMEDIRERCFEGPTPCGNETPSLSNTLVHNGSVYNVWSPLTETDSITLVLEPERVTPIFNDRLFSTRGTRGDSERTTSSKNQKLTGLFALTHDNVSVSGNASGQLSYKPSPAILSEQGVRNFDLIALTVEMATQMGEINLNLRDHPHNRIRVGLDDHGTLSAYVGVALPELAIDMLGSGGIWIEVPVRVGRDGLHVIAEEISGASFTPSAPNQIADWNSDMTVNELDYLAFFEDFALNNADATGDGNTDDYDVELFLELYDEETAG